MLPADARRLKRAVGRRIGELRSGLGWTQDVFAEKASVSVKYVQRVEAGSENLTLTSLARFASLLRVPVASLFKEPRTRSVRRGRPRSRGDPATARTAGSNAKTR